MRGLAAIEGQRGPEGSLGRERVGWSSWWRGGDTMEREMAGYLLLRVRRAAVSGVQVVARAAG